MNNMIYKPTEEIKQQTNNNEITVEYLYTYPVLPLQGGIKQDVLIKSGGKNMDILQEYHDYLAVEHRKQNTRDSYYNTIRKLLKEINKDIETLTKENIDQWIIEKNNQKLEHNTINNYIIRLNLFLKWIDKPEWKFKRIGWRQTNRHILSLEQLIQLREVAKKTNPEHYLIMTLITDVNARPGEICDLKWSNIIDNKIYFDDSKTGNNYGFLTQDLLEALYTYKQVRPVSLPSYEDFVFIGHMGQFKGKRYSHKATRIRKVIKEIIAQTDIYHNVTPYDIRASVGTQEFNQCINPKIIQRKFRHRNLRTTMIYNHIDDKTVEEYANRGLIWNKQSLSPTKTETSKINDRLYIDFPSQNFENDGNNHHLSFSFFFFLNYWNGMGVVLLDSKVTQLPNQRVANTVLSDTDDSRDSCNADASDIPNNSYFFGEEGNIPSQNCMPPSIPLPTTLFLKER